MASRTGASEKNTLRAPSASLLAYPSRPAAIAGKRTTAPRTTSPTVSIRGELRRKGLDADVGGFEERATNTMRETRQKGVVYGEAPRSVPSSTSKQAAPLGAGPVAGDGWMAAVLHNHLPPTLATRVRVSSTTVGPDSPINEGSSCGYPPNTVSRSGSTTVLTIPRLVTAPEETTTFVLPANAEDVDYFWLRANGGSRTTKPLRSGGSATSVGNAGKAAGGSDRGTTNARQRGVKEDTYASYIPPTALSIAASRRSQRSVSPSADAKTLLRIPTESTQRGLSRSPSRSASPTTTGRLKPVVTPPVTPRRGTSQSVAGRELEGPTSENPATDTDHPAHTTERVRVVIKDAPNTYNQIRQFVAAATSPSNAFGEKEKLRRSLTPPPSFSAQGRGVLPAAPSSLLTPQPSARTTPLRRSQSATTPPPSTARSRPQHIGEQTYNAPHSYRRASSSLPATRSTSPSTAISFPHTLHARPSMNAPQTNTNTNNNNKLGGSTFYRSYTSTTSSSYNLVSGGGVPSLRALEMAARDRQRDLMRKREYLMEIAKDDFAESLDALMSHNRKLDRAETRRRLREGGVLERVPSPKKSPQNTCLVTAGSRSEYCWMPLVLTPRRAAMGVPASAGSKAAGATSKSSTPTPSKAGIKVQSTALPTRVVASGSVAGVAAADRAESADEVFTIPTALEVSISHPPPPFHDTTARTIAFGDEDDEDEDGRRINAADATNTDEHSTREADVQTSEMAPSEAATPPKGTPFVTISHSHPQGGGPPLWAKLQEIDPYPPPTNDAKYIRTSPFKNRQQPQVTAATVSLSSSQQDTARPSASEREAQSIHEANGSTCIKDKDPHALPPNSVSNTRAAEQPLKAIPMPIQTPRTLTRRVLREVRTQLGAGFGLVQEETTRGLSSHPPMPPLISPRGSHASATDRFTSSSSSHAAKRAPSVSPASPQPVSTRQQGVGHASNDATASCDRMAYSRGMSQTATAGGTQGDSPCPSPPRGAEDQGVKADSHRNRISVSSRLADWAADEELMAKLDELSPRRMREREEGQPHRSKDKAGFPAKPYLHTTLSIVGGTPPSASRNDSRTISSSPTLKSPPAGTTKADGNNSNIIIPHVPVNLRSSPSPTRVRTSEASERALAASPHNRFTTLYSNNTAITSMSGAARSNATDFTSNPANYTTPTALSDAGSPTNSSNSTHHQNLVGAASSSSSPHRLVKEGASSSPTRSVILEERRLLLEKAGYVYPRPSPKRPCVFGSQHVSINHGNNTTRPLSPLSKDYSSTSVGKMSTPTKEMLQEKLRLLGLPPDTIPASATSPSGPLTYLSKSPLSSDNHNNDDDNRKGMVDEVGAASSTRRENTAGPLWVPSSSSSEADVDSSSRDEGEDGNEYTMDNEAAYRSHQEHQHPTNMSLGVRDVSTAARRGAELSPSASYHSSPTSSSTKDSKSATSPPILSSTTAGLTALPIHILSVEGGDEKEKKTEEGNDTEEDKNARNINNRIAASNTVSLLMAALSEDRLRFLEQGMGGERECRALLSAEETTSRNHIAIHFRIDAEAHMRASAAAAERRKHMSALAEEWSRKQHEETERSQARQALISREASLRFGHEQYEVDARGRICSAFLFETDRVRRVFEKESRSRATICAEEEDVFSSLLSSFHLSKLDNKNKKNSIVHHSVSGSTDAADSLSLSSPSRCLSGELAAGTATKEGVHVPHHHQNNEVTEGGCKVERWGGGIDDGEETNHTNSHHTTQQQPQPHSPPRDGSVECPENEREGGCWAGDISSVSTIQDVSTIVATSATHTSPKSEAPKDRIPGSGSPISPSSSPPPSAAEGKNAKKSIGDTVSTVETTRSYPPANAVVAAAAAGDTLVVGDETRAETGAEAATLLQIPPTRAEEDESIASQQQQQQQQHHQQEGRAVSEDNMALLASLEEMGGRTLSDPQKRSTELMSTSSLTSTHTNEKEASVATAADTLVGVSGGGRERGVALTLDDVGVQRYFTWLRGSSAVGDDDEKKKDANTDHNNYIHHDHEKDNNADEDFIPTSVSPTSPSALYALSPRNSGGQKLINENANIIRKQFADMLEDTIKCGNVFNGFTHEIIVQEVCDDFGVWFSEKGVEGGRSGGRSASAFSPVLFGISSPLFSTPVGSNSNSVGPSAIGIGGVGLPLPAPRSLQQRRYPRLPVGTFDSVMDCFELQLNGDENGSAEYDESRDNKDQDEEVENKDLSRFSPSSALVQKESEAIIDSVGQAALKSIVAGIVVEALSMVVTMDTDLPPMAETSEERAERKKKKNRPQTSATNLNESALSNQDASVGREEGLDPSGADSGVVTLSASSTKNEGPPSSSGVAEVVDICATEEEQMRSEIQAEAVRPAARSVKSELEAATSVVGEGKSGGTSPTSKSLHPSDCSVSQSPNRRRKSI